MFLEKVVKIDIHANCDALFRNSCIDGHLEVCQWLYSLSNNINIHYKKLKNVIY